MTTWRAVPGCECDECQEARCIPLAGYGAGCEVRLYPHGNEYFDGQTAKPPGRVFSTLPTVSPAFVRKAVVQLNNRPLFGAGNAQGSTSRGTGR